MGWYVELHCDGPAGGSCPYGFGEEGPQGQNVKTVAAEARGIGWTQIDGRWRCTRCASDVRLAQL